LPNESATIVKRLWNYCNVLRDDGVSYGDYVEQLTYLLFLKMAEEKEEQLGQRTPIPEAYNWASLKSREGADLERHYREALRELGRGAGLIPVIFRKAQNRIQDPAKLRRLIQMIDEETWTGLDIDVKATVYEGLLEKNAQDTKSGAGQYFTPRALIEAIVDAMAPRPGRTICDPAAGTGGFLIAAHDHIADHHGPLDRDQWHHLNHEALHGWEIVDNTARLCVMNLYLHGVGSTPLTTGGSTGLTTGGATGGGSQGQSPIHVDDALASHPGEYFDVVLTNPPFGKWSSVTYITEEGELRREAQTVVREDFWTSTSNKQLNFLQHVYTILKQHGRAAVVVPDNVLFEGGAGETVRRKLLQTCDVHTLLRLPTGIFYAQGVKANVLFFDRKPAREEPWTKKLWIYDLRTNQHFTLKRHPLTREDLDAFVAGYHPENRHERTPTWAEDEAEIARLASLAQNDGEAIEIGPNGRWRAYDYEELIARDKANLDIFWIRDESLEETANLPEPDVLAADIVEDLGAALEQFRAVAEDLQG
jgi:type I restriction enzyme M protein